jgi:hypothetical protein
MSDDKTIRVRLEPDQKIVIETVLGTMVIQAYPKPAPDPRQRLL